MEFSEIRAHCYVLNVTPDFLNKSYNSQEELDRELKEFKSLIKVKYRKLLHRLHPDKIGGDEETAKKVINAYNLLKDLSITLRPRQPVVQVVEFSYTWTGSGATTSGW